MAGCTNHSSVYVGRCDMSQTTVNCCYFPKFLLCEHMMECGRMNWISIPWRHRCYTASPAGGGACSSDVFIFTSSHISPVEGSYSGVGFFKPLLCIPVNTLPPTPAQAPSPPERIVGVLHGSPMIHPFRLEHEWAPRATLRRTPACIYK